MNLSQGILGRGLQLRHAVIFSFALVNILMSCQACRCSFQPQVCDGRYIFEGTIRDIYGNASGFADITYSVEVESITMDVDMSLASGDVVNISTGTHTCGFPDLEVGWTVLFSILDKQGLYSYFIDRCGSVVRTADDDKYMPSDTDLICTASAPAMSTATPLLLFLCSAVAMWLYSQQCN